MLEFLGLGVHTDMSIRGQPVSDSLIREAEAVRLHPSDNVLVAPRRIPAGVRIAREGVTATQSIPMGHKLAATAIPAGALVRKYGQVIGVATADIAAGAQVHVHNLAMSECRLAAEPRTNAWARVEEPRS